MKVVKLNIEEIVKERFESPEIGMVVMDGLNYHDVCVLTQSPNKTYFWSNINSTYNIQGVDGETEFENIYHAIFRAMVEGKQLCSFENSEEFAKWYGEGGFDNIEEEENK